MKHLILLIFCIFLISCSGPKIEQDVGKISILTSEYRITTAVFMYNSVGYPKTLEYWNIVTCDEKQIDSVKYSERMKAEYVIEKINQHLINNEHN